MSIRNDKSPGGARGAAPAAIVPKGKTSPLELWRDPASAVDRKSLRRLAGTLDRLHVLHEPYWRDALGTDAAAAIGIAMRNLIPGRDGGLGLLDVAMSAVLFHAVRGNAAAILVLEHGSRCI